MKILTSKKFTEFEIKWNLKVLELLVEYKQELENCNPLDKESKMQCFNRYLCKKEEARIDFMFE